jgi:hypothetical protein
VTETVLDAYEVPALGDDHVRHRVTRDVAVSARHLLLAPGYGAPVAGRFADATAAELLLGTDDDVDTVFAELQAWRATRAPADAARELADAASELDDPALTNLALAALDTLDVDVAAPEVRRLADDRGVRGFALAGWSTTAPRTTTSCTTPPTPTGSSTCSPTAS